MTSNRTRELHDALRRRCVYHSIAYPDPSREAEIIMLRAPLVARTTANAVAKAISGLRQMSLSKPPGIAEAVEWANAATLLEAGSGAWPRAFVQAIGTVIKDEDDYVAVRDKLETLVREACR
jgi:MoxR-like ATPase